MSTAKSAARRLPHWGVLLLATFALLIAAGAILVWQPYRDEQRIIDEVKRYDGWVSTEYVGPSFLQNWLGKSGRKYFERVDYVSTYMQEQVSPPSKPVDDRYLATIVKLDHLRSLYIDSPSVFDTGIAHLAARDNLVELTLKRANVSEAGLRTVAALPRLEFLRISDTPLNDAGFDEIASCKSLKHLIVENSNVTDAQVEKLLRLPLKTLRLRGTQITDGALAHIGRMHSLVSLGLGNSKISDPGLVHVASLPNLVDLEINNTGVTDAGLAHLHRATKLRRVFAPETKISQAAIDALESATGCDVESN